MSQNRRTAAAEGQGADYASAAGGDAASFEVRGAYFEVHHIRWGLAKGPEVLASHALSRGSHPQRALGIGGSPFGENLSTGSAPLIGVERADAYRILREASSGARRLSTEKYRIALPRRRLLGPAFEEWPQSEPWVGAVEAARGVVALAV